MPFKIASMMRAILSQSGPAYLSNMVRFNREESGRRRLRSSTTNEAPVMRGGGAENDGHEDAGHEIAGHKNLFN